MDESPAGRTKTPRTLNKPKELADSELKLIDSFIDIAWAERGLSKNTLASYRYDLISLAQHQQKRKQSLGRYQYL